MKLICAHLGSPDEGHTFVVQTVAPGKVSLSKHSEVTRRFGIRSQRFAAIFIPILEPSRFRV